MSIEDSIRDTYIATKDGKLVRSKSSNRWPAGYEPSWVTPGGYKKVIVNGKHLFVHRVLFWLYHGYWPKLVDHINRDRLDNSVDNLRDVSQLVNANNRGLNSNNKSGVRGVRWHKATGKWEATATYNYKRKYLGLHDTVSEAEDAILSFAEMN